MLKTIYRKYCRTKDQNTKGELYNSFKFHCNTQNELKIPSKANQYCSYFEENKNRIIKIRDGIRGVIHISKKATSQLNI